MRHPLAALRLAFGSVCMAIAGISIHANAAESFALDSISVLATNRAKPNAVVGLGTADGAAKVLQYEHFGINNWGTFYFDLESTHGHGAGSINSIGDNGSAYQMFAVAVPRVSLSKLTGKSFTFGPISDVSLVGRALQSSYYHYQAVGVGVTLSFDVPGFLVFDSGLLTHDTWWDLSPTFDRNTGRRQRLDKNKWMWRTYMMSKPLDYAGQRFNFNLQGYVNGSGNGNANKHGTEVLLITDYLWNIGGNSDYQLGLRHMYSRHKNSLSLGFGDNSYRSSVPYLMFKYTL